MGRPTMPVPEKFCEWCGNTLERRRHESGRLEDRGVFMRRKFCSLSCSVSSQHATAAPTVAASRKRAHKIAKQNCEICGSSSNPNVHHIDNNPMNNDPSNLQALCASCHGFWHAAAKRKGIAVPGRMPCIFP